MLWFASWDLTVRVATLTPTTSYKLQITHITGGIFLRFSPPQAEKITTLDHQIHPELTKFEGFSMN